jgi:hypothetical protein
MMDIDPKNFTVDVRHEGEAGSGRTFLTCVYRREHHTLALMDTWVEENLDRFRACLKILSEPRFIHPARGGCLKIWNVTPQRWEAFVDAIEAERVELRPPCK